MSHNHYASERDFVANYVLPKIKEASKVLGVLEIIDLHIEKSINGGVTDLTIERGGRGLLVLEAKFKKKIGKREIDIEPRDPDVINQAVNYAVHGGFKFYSTCNAKRLVLFQLIPGKRPHESEIVSFEYEKNSQWNIDCLKYILELTEIKLKQVDDTLVDILHEAFIDLYPEFLFSLKEKLVVDKFKKDYVEWLESQGISLNDETNRLIASQTAYLQINKLLFYQVIRQIYPDRLSRLEIKEDEDISETLSIFYEQVKKIDYQPIYQSDLISEIPLTLKAKERFRTLLDTLNEFDFSTMESDFLGRIYEKLIPPHERKRLGQFYTPPPIVDFILRLTLKNKDDTILDPACGSGTFLVRAYHKFRELNKYPTKNNGGLTEFFHKNLLEKIYGIDINQFPAHLSVINLAIQNPKAKVDRMNLMVNDTFNIRSGQSTLFGFQSLDTKGTVLEIEIPRSFDIIVSNPPYIRQELLGNNEKKKIKDLIESEYSKKLFLGKPDKSIKNGIILDKQSDVYIYFYIHSLSLLKNNGKLGFISSNKWLEVRYGEPFQQFLLDTCKILYIIEFDRSIFPDADVNTSIVILEKEHNADKRNQNKIRFARFKQKMNIDQMIKIVEKSFKNLETDSYRVNIIEQDQIKPGKWNIYLRAPSVFHKILKNQKITPLQNIAKVVYGIKTGYNDYFVLSREKVKEWKIEKDYLKPCLSSPKNLDGVVLSKEKVNEYFINVKNDVFSLKNKKVIEYLKYGEKLEVNVTRGSVKGRRKLTEMESVKGHTPWWYSLPELPTPPILFQYMIDVKGDVVWNKAGAQATDVFHYIIPNDEKDDLVLLGYLNSTLSSLCVELFGRSYGGGILKIQAYELQDLPVLDTRKISKKEKEKISHEFKDLADIIEEKIDAENKLKKLKSRKKENKGISEDEFEKKIEALRKKEKESRKQIDDVIFEILEVKEDDKKQIIKGLIELQELRKARAEE